MSTLLTVSPSPHVHGHQSTRDIMYGVVIALLPALAVSVFVFGIGALIVTALSIIGCMFFEFLIQKYLLKSDYDLLDGSAIVTGMLLAFNVPSNLPWWIIMIGSLMAIGVGKMSFGGLGKNPFNPALVGRVFLLISFPVQMTSWPEPMVNRFTFTDAVTGATPLSIIKEGLRNGESISALMDQVPSYTSFLLGFQGGSLGEMSALALILGLIYMLYKKIITWHIPVSLIGSVFVFTGALWLVNPEQYADPVFHVLTGGALLGAFFMATDYVTSPMHYRGMIIFGIGIGLLTVLIRVFGAYPEGISFAILIMNGFVPLINKYFKPKRFGKVKHG
ncbi:MAG: RnfABCDGE type electron transport complex subunit D [Candidatus Cyclobacteriaceae bacterium M3_2C_046]